MILISEINIQINNINVYSLVGHLFVGKAYIEHSVNDHKTINGVGNAYGDNSNINMSPKNSLLADPDQLDNQTNYDAGNAPFFNQI